MKIYSLFPIFVLDFKELIREFNPDTRKILKYDENDWIGKNFQKIAEFPSGCLEILKKTFIGIIQGQKFRPAEIPSYDKDGNMVWIYVTATLVKLYNENLVQVIIQGMTGEKLTKERIIGV